MPEIWPEVIEWDDGNMTHATGHGVSMEEITQVIASGPTYRQNRRGRSADLLAFGLTDGGRAIVVAVAWDAATRTIRPITAWEQ